MERPKVGEEARWTWTCFETVEREGIPCGFMLHTDMEMLYQIDAVDVDGFIECNIGDGDQGTGDDNKCPVDTSVEATVDKYINVSKGGRF